MLIIGLTGGIGSGKTTVAQLFAEQGALIIDTDQLARELTQPGQPALHKIKDYFGDEILLDNKLNRAKLRKIVFNDQNKRQWLENLLHPLIRAEIEKILEQARKPYAILVIPLLFETQPNPLIQRILVVDAPEELQIERATARDQATADEIRSILKTQVNRTVRLAGADDIIENDGSLENLKNQVATLDAFYKNINVTSHSHK